MTESAGEVSIRSRDYWFKIVDFLQRNWALIDESADGFVVWFLSDQAGVFDDLRFENEADAVRALRRNGFQRYADAAQAREMIAVRQPPFSLHPHPNGRIYSSGRFWK